MIPSRAIHAKVRKVRKVYLTFQRKSHTSPAGNVKDVQLFMLGPVATGRPAIAVSNNNGPLQLYAYTR